MIKTKENQVKEEMKLMHKMCVNPSIIAVAEDDISQSKVK